MPGTLFAPENAKLLQAFEIQFDSPLVAGDWVSMAHYHKCLIVVQETRFGQGDKTVLRVDEAFDNTGTGAVTGITLNNYWTLLEIPSVTGDTGASALIVSDTMTKGTPATTVTIDTDPVAASLVIIDIDAHELGEPYDYIQVHLDDAGVKTSYVGATYIMYEPRYAQAVPPSVIT